MKTSKPTKTPQKKLLKQAATVGLITLGGVALSLAGGMLLTLAFLMGDRTDYSSADLGDLDLDDEGEYFYL